MYAPNQYYQPYTATPTEGRARRSSSSSGSHLSSSTSSRTGNSNNNNGSSSKGSDAGVKRHGEVGAGEGRGLCTARCCCVTLVLLLVSVSTAAGILGWVLNREQLLVSSGSLNSADSSNNHINSVTDSFSDDVSSPFQSGSDSTRFPARPKNDNIVFPKGRSDISHHEADDDSSDQASSSTTTTSSTPSPSTTTPKLTTYGPKYTEIITKMKEMRKQRLSNKRFFGASVPSVQDEDEDVTTTPMTGDMSSTPPPPPPTLSSPTASSAPLVTKAKDTPELEEAVTVNEDSQEDVAETETTTIKVENVEDLLQTSRFLRFEQEVLANFTRSARNHVRDTGDNKESAVAANSIPEDKAKEKDVKEAEAAPLLTSSLLTPIATSTVARVTETATEAATEDSSSRVFFAYPDLPTFTIEPDTETFCELVDVLLITPLFYNNPFCKNSLEQRKGVSDILSYKFCKVTLISCEVPS